MRIQSCKAKGRRLVQEVKELILKIAAPHIEPDDIHVPVTSCPGSDLWLSPKAKSILPLVFEVKNQETAKPWEWIAQAAKYATDGRCPVVVFSRNREPSPYAIIELKDLLAFVVQAQTKTTPFTDQK